MTTGKIVLIAVLGGAIGVVIAVFGQRWLEDGKPFEIALPNIVHRSGDRLDNLPEFRLPASVEVLGGTLVVSSLQALRADRQAR